MLHWLQTFPKNALVFVMVGPLFVGPGSLEGLFDFYGLPCSKSVILGNRGSWKDAISRLVNRLTDLGRLELKLAAFVLEIWI